MGWLRDLMAGAPSEVKSYGELARTLLANPDWPTSTRMRERSLSALFSKMDRGEGLDWLVERNSVQHLLAETLSCSVAEVRAAIGAVAPTSSSPTRLVRLRGLPRARTLDLLDEPLFPGLPVLVLSPEQWNYTWWHAPSGAGRSLVGQWLRVRERVAFLDSPQELGPRPLYLELNTPHQLEGLVLPARVCVAAGFPPPATWPEGSSIHGPPASEYLSEFIEWVSARLPKTPPFDSFWAKRWLSTPAIAMLLDTPGTVLDLCGVLDDLGKASLENLSVRELGEKWLAKRLRLALDRGDAAAAHLGETGLALLIGLITRALTDSAQPWDAPRSFDDWLALIPHEYQQTADVEWLALSLERADSSIRPREIRRAARNMPLGAFRALRALTQIEVLSPVAPGEELLQLRPRWLGNLLVAEAESALVRGSALEWGEVLLNQPSSRLHRTVASKLERAPSELIEATLELEGSREPGYCCAIESLVVHTGLALLVEGESNADTFRDLLDEQLSLMVELPDSPPAPRVYPRWPTGAAAFHGVWLLAMLALSELGMARPRRESFFGVWQSSRLPPKWRAALDIIAVALQAHALEPWVPAAFGLVDRLRSSVGSVAEDGRGWHALERPGLFVEEASFNALTWLSAQELGASTGTVGAMEWLTKAQRAKWSSVARGVWNAWLEAASPDVTGTLLDPDSEFRDRFWPHCPEQALEQLASSGGPVAFTSLSSKQWDQMLQQLHEGKASLVARAETWRALPESLVDGLIARGLKLPDIAWTELWRRFPLRCSSAAQRLAEESIDLAAAVTALSPDVAAGYGLDLFESVNLQNLLPQTRGPVRTWLHARVRDKGSEWRRAHELLFKLDAALSGIVPIP